MHYGAPTPAGQSMEMGGLRWKWLWMGGEGSGVECGSGDVARKDSAMEKCRLYLSRFVPEFEKNFLVSHGGWAFSPRLCCCLTRLPPPTSIETLTAPRSLTGAPNPAP